MALSQHSKSAIRHVASLVAFFLSVFAGLASSPSGPVLDPAASFSVAYVVVLFCFQATFMEWPHFDTKVFTVLSAAHINFALPTMLSSYGIAATFWNDTCIAWCPYVWLSSALISVAAYYWMVVGPAPSNKDPNSLEGKVCIITGSNTGIGYETAVEFAKRGAIIIMACRSEDKARAAIDTVAQRIPGCKERLHFLKLDLSSLESVRAFVKNFEATGMDLHVLVLNAGVMLSSRQLSKDGLEMTLASNILGHFLLTQLLLPALFAAEEKGLEPRIINVGSTFHLCHDAFDFEEAVKITEEKAIGKFLSKPYEIFNAYGHSKLGGMLLNGELARRLAKKGSKIPANVVHPGQCMSEVQRNMHPVLLFLYSAFSPIVGLFMKSAQVGSWGTVHLATAKELATSVIQTGGFSGEFFLHMFPAKLSDAARNEAAAQRLWDVAIKLTDAPEV